MVFLHEQKQETEMDVFDLKFEHIDWNDIADAELSGDQAALEQLMNRSMELRRQKSNSEASEPTTPSLSTPKDSLPFAEFLEKEDKVPNINSAPSVMTRATPFSSRSSCGLFKRPQTYAQITRGAGKVGKRKAAERIGLSPIDLPKKKTYRELISPPPIINEPLKTPDLTNVGDSDEGIMDINTPESDRVLRASVQRRLFGFGGKQTSSPQHSYPPWHLKINDDKMTDIHKLAQRQKQIDFGKNTIGYEIYTQQQPKWKRSRNDPWTPDKYKPCSTRSWQGQIRIWRRSLHKYDPMTSSSQQQQQFTEDDAALCEISLELGENPLDV